MQPCDILSQAYHAAHKFRMTYTHQCSSDPGRCIVFRPPEKSAATTAPRGVSALWFGFLLCRNLCANLSCIACELGESSLPILRCIPAILRWYASVNYKCIKVTCIGNWQRVCGLAQKCVQSYFAPGVEMKVQVYLDIFIIWNSQIAIDYSSAQISVWVTSGNIDLKLSTRML